MAEKENNKNEKQEKKPDYWKGNKKTDNTQNDEGMNQGGGMFNFNKGQFRFSIWYFLVAIIIMLIINSLFTASGYNEIEYSTFKEKIKQGEIIRVEMAPHHYLGFTVSEEKIKEEQVQLGEKSYTTYKTVPVKPDDKEFVNLLEKHNVEYYAIPDTQNPFVIFLLNWLVPIGLIAFVWIFLFRKMGNPNSGVMSFGKNKSRIVAQGETGVRFNDIAGADESKEELVEVVDFLQEPKKYADIGGKIPKGVMLVGAPGTGKTLMAKAVAGEAGVPFFRMSGADFVEMFVGVGAARVRDLFKQAREKAPCIIFIDELDAIGKARGQASGGGNDEREQTLNQLLVEMDGFDSRTGVILLAATNRPEILDPALLRPGRFDRQVLINKPDLKEREAILKIHSKEVKMEQNVDISRIARSTPGLTGADLANIVNEAALLAVRDNRKKVAQDDFMEAIEKIMAGLKKKNRVMDPEERRRIAYHEVGHGITAYCTEGAAPVEKISIVPRGFGALGYTMQLPEEEKTIMTEKELLARVDVLLGGRATEEVLFHDISTGASDDLTKASDTVRKMITDYGMSDKFRNVYLPTKKGGQFLPGTEISHREYSENTQNYIDEETANVIRRRYEGVLSLIKDSTHIIENLSKILLEKETITKHEFESAISESSGENGGEGLDSDTEENSNTDS